MKILDVILQSGKKNIARRLDLVVNGITDEIVCLSHECMDFR